MSLLSFFSNIGTKITGWFQKEQPVVQKAYNDANNVVNIAKSLLGSATGQTIILVLEALTPGASAAVITAINTVFAGWGWIGTEIDKNPEQLAADGINKLSQMTAGDTKTAGLHTVTAVIGNTLANINGGDSTLQQALTTIGLVHNPSLLDGLGAQQTAPSTNYVSPAKEAK